MSLIIRIEITNRCADLPAPARASSGSSGFDLRAAVGEPAVIPAGGRMLIPTGISVAVPHGFEAQVRSRSGLALKHGVAVLNSPGTIDSDYRGEISVILINHGAAEFRVERGDRIAQLVIAAVVEAELEIVDSLPPTDRGQGGFGSSGKR